MQLNKQKMLFDLFTTVFIQLDMDNARSKGNGFPQIGDTLQVRVPIGDGDDMITIDLMLVSLNDKLDILQFYTVIVPEIGEGYDDLVQALPEMNFYCPAGSFGIYQEGRQFYHRYGLFMPANMEPQEAARETMDILELLFNLINDQYIKIRRMSKGKA